MEQKEFTEDIAKIYALDNERRERLSSMLQTVINGQRSMDMNQDAINTEQLRNRVNSETFKILIIGEFNTGKSTFINALLGSEVLPTKAIPATAIINEVRYGETAAARLHFIDPEKDPIDIPIEQLNKYVLIKNAAHQEAAQEEIRQTPFSHAEIWWPIELCKENNVEIIDSPGLNEAKVREDVTLGYLKKVDVVLFLMAAGRFGPAQTEKDTLKLLEAAGHQDIFFIINKWDILRPRQQEEVKNNALGVLKKLTSRQEDIYFVSALDALEGRIYKDPALETKSGFQDMEAALHQFLAQEQGKMKALRSSRELRRINRKMETDAIPRKINLLKMPLGELQEKYEAAKKDLDQLETDKKDMLHFMARQKTQITNLTKMRVKEFFYTIDEHVDSWAEEHDMEIGTIPSKEKINKAMEGLTNKLKDNLTESFEEWEVDNLTPFVEDRMKSLYDELKIRAINFENHLNDAQFTLNGTHFNQLDVKDEFGPENALERILAGAGGFFLGGVGMGAIGAIFGYQEMLRSLLPNIAAVVVAIVVGLPVLPFMLIAALFSGSIALDRIGEKIKKKVAQEFKTAIREKSGDQIDQITDQLATQLNELSKALEKGMEHHIDEVKEQAETALSAHQKGQNEVDKKLATIEQIKIELGEVNIELDDFIDDLVNPLN